MNHKKVLYALALSGLLLTACGKNDGFELVDVGQQTAAGTEVKTITETVEQQFPITTKVDKTLAPGAHKVITKGERGQSRVTYEVTYKNGKEVSRKALSEVVVKKPVAAVVAVGPSKSDQEEGESEVIGYSQPTSGTADPSQPARTSTSHTDPKLVSDILDNPDEYEDPEPSSSASSSSSAQTSIPELPSGPSSGSEPEPSEDPSSESSILLPEEGDQTQLDPPNPSSENGETDNSGEGKASSAPSNTQIDFIIDPATEN